jgi:hypothetical protein
MLVSCHGHTDSLWHEFTYWRLAAAISTSIQQRAETISTILSHAVSSFSTIESTQL